MKVFTYYNCGRFPEDTEDLFMFTCWNNDHTGCGCHSVYASDLQNNIRALEIAGYVNMNGHKWDFARAEWVRIKQAA